MREDAPDGEGGTAIYAQFDFADHLWGGYMFMNGYLAPGETAAQPDFGEHDAGLDLRGATHLVFEAKGEEGGESVEFFAGGIGHTGGIANFPDSMSKLTGGYLELTDEWETYTLSLSRRHLNRVACGFGWVTHRDRNRSGYPIGFYIRNIRYEYEDDAVRRTPMFLQSYATATPGTDEAIINDFAYLYDSAAAAMALSYAGEHDRARQIADAIVYSVYNDRYFSDGRLRNAYAAGDPRSFPGWSSERGGEFARIPGFYDVSDGNWYEDAYAVSTTTGNMAWAIMTLCEVSDNFDAADAGGAKANAGGGAGASAGEGADGDAARTELYTGEDYLQVAEDIADFVLTLRDGKGGFTGGYEGWEGSQTKVTYKSTEHNIDLITAFGRLHELTGESKYKDAAAHAKKFVLSMYDGKRGCFYTGTGDDGVSVSSDVLPLDSNTWALLALGDEFEDTEKVLAFIEKNMAVGDGYDFNADRDGVWHEGTAQVALAYLFAGDEKKYDEIMEYLNESAARDGSITAADRDGVTTGFMVSGTDVPWEYGKRTHVGATAWLAFAQMKENPFAY
jgi:hypothetical protein